MLIERAARYASQQPVDMETVPAWQVRGVRAVLAWNQEEQANERAMNQMRSEVRHG